MSRFEISDENKSTVAGAFRLSFQNDGERWTHSIAIAGRVIALSQESDPERDDPSSIACPTYQQCHTQEVPNALETLLVGLWGAHHCSAVFHVEEKAAAEVELDIDVAVRSRSQLLGFASTYRIRLTSQDLISADGSAVVWDIREPLAGKLTLRGGEGTRIALAEAGRQETAVQINVLLIPSTATQRLPYAWSWIPGV